MKTLDISNYTGTLPQETLQFWRNDGVQHIIVRLSLETAEKTQLAHNQIAACRDYHFRVSGYIWCYITADDPQQVVQQTLAHFPNLTSYWLDVEDVAYSDARNTHVNVQWLEQACQALAQAGVRFGIYTAQSFWDRYFHTDRFAQYPLWLALWDGIADLTVWQPFGGWEHLVGKQYLGDVFYGGKRVDLSVFDPQWLQRYVYPFTAQARYGTAHWDGKLAVDVFDAYGAPIVACTDGVAIVRDYPLGGHTVTLHGDDTYYYYHAHLVPGTGVAGRVAAGQRIGQVGDSGNAAGKPPHCHFAIGSASYGIDADGAGDQPPWEWLDAWRGTGDEPTIDDLRNLLGYLQGDVADALQRAAEDLYHAARTRRAAAREAAYTALRAAIDTLRRGG